MFGFDFRQGQAVSGRFCRGSGPSRVEIGGFLGPDRPGTLLEFVPGARKGVATGGGGLPGSGSYPEDLPGRSRPLRSMSPDELNRVAEYGGRSEIGVMTSTNDASHLFTRLDISTG